MAKWKLNQAGLQGAIQYDGSVGDSHWQLYQDERPFLEQAKRERELGTKKTHHNHKKFATIPEIVAIEIKEKYGIDLHSLTFMDDLDAKARFMTIIQQDYPHLVVNKR